jgi:hypothetical protein
MEEVSLIFLDLFSVETTELGSKKARTRGTRSVNVPSFKRSIDSQRNALLNESLKARAK